ncbi:hypothetical protein JB92DRAFT_2837271 [Gautieria morchelliformis]|nr:hypothetical protein JB92DRAFT_2837271 [Gautieria morchelliformis]
MADEDLLVARIRLTREILILGLLGHRDQTLPVPQIHGWVFDPSEAVGAPFSLMERLMGKISGPRPGSLHGMTFTLKDPPSRSTLAAPSIHPYYAHYALDFSVLAWDNTPSSFAI